jgi:hypothetical protein
MNINGIKPGFLQHFQRQFLTPHGPQSGAALRQ